MLKQEQLVPSSPPFWNQPLEVALMRYWWPDPEHILTTRMQQAGPKKNENVLNRFQWCLTHKPLDLETRTLINQNMGKDQPSLFPLTLSPKNCNYAVHSQMLIHLHLLLCIDIIPICLCYILQISYCWSFCQMTQFSHYHQSSLSGLEPTTHTKCCCVFHLLNVYPGVHWLPCCIHTSFHPRNSRTVWRFGSCHQRLQHIQNVWNIHLGWFIIPLNVPVISGVWKNNVLTWPPPASQPTSPKTVHNLRAQRRPLCHCTVNLWLRSCTCACLCMLHWNHCRQESPLSFPFFTALQFSVSLFWDAHGCRGPARDHSVRFSRRREATLTPLILKYLRKLGCVPLRQAGRQAAGVDRSADTDHVGFWLYHRLCRTCRSLSLPEHWPLPSFSSRPI